LVSQINQQIGNGYDKGIIYNDNSVIENNITLYRILRERFEAENADKINNLYNSMIETDFRTYYSLLQKVNNKEGLYYYATNGEEVFTNCDRTERDYFTGFKAYYLFDKQGVEVFPTNK
jgi:hypothetical protein